MCNKNKFCDRCRGLTWEQLCDLLGDYHCFLDALEEHLKGNAPHLTPEFLLKEHQEHVEEIESLTA
jgi:hypothetical protein